MDWYNWAKRIVDDYNGDRYLLTELDNFVYAIIQYYEEKDRENLNLKALLNTYKSRLPEFRKKYPVCPRIKKLMEGG